MSSYDVKRIADPVHGTIGVSELELRVMHTQVFQRLRNIKQLGLAHYVYPGADYSRLSHSVGVCHVTGRILEALRRNKANLELPEDQYQLYRLAALLHDIGHYPYSHAMEEALKIHYTKFADIVRQPQGAASTTQKPLNHEKVGKEIITRDPELNGVLTKAGINPDSLQKIFDHGEEGYLANIISSDLDADRIDYLLRTARHTGLPYGSIDLDYILSQLSVDETGRVCISAKAVRTADHFLLCRYFDYQQVSFHKTVAAFEMVLKDVISVLLRSGRIKGSAEEVKGMISGGGWHRFDDAQIMQQIIELADDGSTDYEDLLKARAILERNPPKLIYKREYLKARDEVERRDLISRKHDLEQQIPRWAEEFGIDKSLWYLWHKPGIALTKIGSFVPISSLVEKNEGDDQDVAQSIHVLEKGQEKSQLIVGLEYSLLKLFVKVRT
jgi:uncharacterized protein